MYGAGSRTCGKGQIVEVEAMGKTGVFAELEERTGIRQIVLQEICTLAEEYDVERVVLFGSRARGDHGERSDIDLAVYGGNYVYFSLDVDDTTSTLLKYDFVNMSASVQPELLEAIEREGVCIYEKI